MSKRCSIHRVKRNQQLIEAQRLLEGHTMDKKACNDNQIAWHQNQPVASTQSSAVEDKLCPTVMTKEDEESNTNRQTDIESKTFIEKFYECGPLSTKMGYYQQNKTPDIAMDGRISPSMGTKMYVHLSFYL